MTIAGGFSLIRQEIVGFQGEGPKAQCSFLIRGGKEEQVCRDAHNDQGSGHSILRDVVFSRDLGSKIIGQEQGQRKQY